MNARVSIGALVLGLALASPVSASDQGYIYGRVETVNGDEYEGQIRWGKEEAFWDDVFNATKVENENLGYVDRKVLRSLSRRNNGGWGYLFGNAENDFDHIFAVRFGDLKEIRVRRGENLIGVFRNGEELELEGGSNDVGAVVTVVDPKLGIKKLSWRSIRSVEFRETPAKLEDKLGEPIYGTVKAGAYSFTGRIQWDNDECLTVDELDGDTEDGDEAIPFGDIAAIRKHRAGALVTLKTGQDLYLTGSNDVNDDNRGVVVIVPEIGSVKVGWEDFDEVKFTRAPNSGRGYAAFAAVSDLLGTVVTEGGKFDGRIVFDLDEAWDFEMLHGTNGDTEYLIPFREIRRIKPHGTRRADVELRTGLTIELEDSQDVTRKNDGLLVFSGNAKPRYVAWPEVREVVFAGHRERPQAERPAER